MCPRTALTLRISAACNRIFRFARLELHTATAIQQTIVFVIARQSRIQLRARACKLASVQQVLHVGAALRPDDRYGKTSHPENNECSLNESHVIASLGA